MRARRVGVIGVGNLGAAMARRLVSSDFDVVAFDIDKHALDAVAAHGIQRVDSPREWTLGGGVRGRINQRRHPSCAQQCRSG